MPAVYSSQPISGFTGHIPGSKWQVGSRYIPPIKEAHPTSVSYVVEHSNSSKEEVTEDNSSQSSETIQPIVQNGAVERPLDKQRDTAHHTAKEYHNPQKGNRSQGVHFVQERSHNRFTEQETFYSQGLGNHSSDFSLLHSGDSDISMEFRTQGSSHSEESWQVKGQQREQSMKQRAHSLPRKIMEKDPFEGLTGGWWSKGEVLRNKERRELANRGKTVIAGEFQRIESPKQRKWQDNTSNYDDIPAAGYSGHMPGFRQMEIGKSFNTAAREAKRNYAMQRRARSGGREQVAVAYGAENWSDTQLINTQTSLNSSTNDHLKGDQVQSTGKGL